MLKLAFEPPARTNEIGYFDQRYKCSVINIKTRPNQIRVQHIKFYHCVSNACLLAGRRLVIYEFIDKGSSTRRLKVPRRGLESTTFIGIIVHLAGPIPHAALGHVVIAPSWHVELVSEASVLCKQSQTLSN